MRTLGSMNQPRHTESHIISKCIIAGFHCTLCKKGNLELKLVPLLMKVRAQLEAGLGGGCNSCLFLQAVFCASCW